jgi:kynurenine formamidase
MTTHPLAALLADYDVVDLSHTLEEGMPNFPTHSQFSHDIWESYWDGDVAVAYQVKMNEHSGTHVDAPAHFIQEGESHSWIDSISATRLIGRAVTIDVSATPAATSFGIDALEGFEAANGPLEVGDIVFFRTGWEDKWRLQPDTADYMADYPGVGGELARALTARGVAAVGTDTIGLDTFGDKSFPAHYELLGKGVLIFENLTNLAQLPAVSWVIAIPLRIAGGSGSPLRPLAFVPASLGKETL